MYKRNIVIVNLFAAFVVMLVVMKAKGRESILYYDPETEMLSLLKCFVFFLRER